MKKTLLSIVMLASIFMFSNINSFAQGTVTATANAEVMASLSVQELTQLNFGKFSPEASGGTVVVATDGVRTKTSTVALLGGTVNQATFQMSATPLSKVALVLPTSTLITNAISAKSMTVNSFTLSPSLSGGGDITMPASGTQTLNVGGTLNVGVFTSNPVGLYTGTYTITFSYN